MCAIVEIGVDAVMSSIGYLFENISNACVWYDAYVRSVLSIRYLFRIGGNALRVYERLREGDRPHGLKALSPTECAVERLWMVQREVGFVLYNKD